MRQRAAASLLYQSQHAEPAFRNLQNLIFLKIVGRILAFYKEAYPVIKNDAQSFKGQSVHSAGWGDPD